jgi:ketosteroid isomerase-like protein
MPVTRAALTILALHAVASCAPDADVAAERALLVEADRRYIEAANAGDVDGLAALYADDATRYPPDGEPTSGPEAMRAFAEGVASTPGFHLSATPLELEISRSGDLAYTLNALELTTTDPDGALVVQRLRDFHTWRREGEGWKIVVDIWHVMTTGQGAGS